MNKLLILSLAFSSALACSKKKNEVEPAVRLTADSINPTAALTANDPASVKSGMETWLQYYPNDTERFFDADQTTALGIIATKYFQATDKAPWLEIMHWLLEKGANPNIVFNYDNKRVGILHVAAIQGDSALVTDLITRLGTVEPPLRLSCDLPRQEPTEATGKKLDLNLQEAATGYTPLHYAVQAGIPDPQFVEYLLLQGANPNLQNESLKLTSPTAMAADNPTLVSVFQRYSGNQIQYDSGLNILINTEIEKAPKDRLSMLDLAIEYRKMVERIGFEPAQGINQVITLCKTGERANLMGYALRYIFPEIVLSPLTADSRNKNIVEWMNKGAQICVKDDLSIKEADASFRPVSLKDLFKSSLAAHATLAENSTAPAMARVRTLNKTLWCTTVKQNAEKGGCWNPATDNSLTPKTACDP